VNNSSCCERVHSLPYVLNMYSRIPGAQSQEYEQRIPPGEPSIRQEHVRMQECCIHKTG